MLFVDALAMALDHGQTGTTVLGCTLVCHFWDFDVVTVTTYAAL